MRVHQDRGERKALFNQECHSPGESMIPARLLVAYYSASTWFSLSVHDTFFPYVLIVQWWTTCDSVALCVIRLVDSKKVQALDERRRTPKDTSIAYIDKGVQAIKLVQKVGEQCKLSLQPRASFPF